MVTLEVKNLKEVEEQFHDEIKTICEEKRAYYDELFKNYDKDLTLEVIFDKSSSIYKISVSLNLKNKKVLSVEENKDALKAITKLFSEFKKVVKKQYDLEKKEYEYKRKR
jgi:ribosome-associated translation inhibitor RaiA